MSAADLVEALSHRGITLSAIGGRLEVRPASALTARDRAAIRSQVAGLIAALQPAREPWGSSAAVRLMTDADALVGQLGVDGRHPAVEAAAAMVVSASASRDLEAVRFAVSEFVVTVRRAACERPLAGDDRKPT